MPTSTIATHAAAPSLSLIRRPLPAARGARTAPGSSAAAPAASRIGAPAAAASPIETTLSRLVGLEHREGDQDDPSEDDRCGHVSPSDLDGPTQARRHELELRIAERAHLGQVEPLEFDVGADALPDEDVDQGVEDVGEGEDHPYQRTDADQLGHELAGIAVEEPGDRAVDAVPAPAVVAR